MYFKTLDKLEKKIKYRTLCVFLCIKMCHKLITILETKFDYMFFSFVFKKIGNFYFKNVERI